MASCVQSDFATSILYGVLITTIKISILLFYQRIFATPKFLLATRLLAVPIIAWGIAVILVQVFACNPIHGYWNTAVPSKCIDPAAYYVGVAVPNILTDVILLCLPVRMVWRLQLQVGQKIAVSITFLTGAMYDSALS